MKKITAILIMTMLLITGCAKKPAAKNPTPNPEPTPEVTEPVLYKNNLTGEYEFETDKSTLRPVAVSVNNQVKSPRKMQTGLDQADIVYETYVEGGITRTLAIYKDISQVDEIGSIRSARYDFVDLACSNDATYIHAGVDYTYCQPYINKLGLDDANLLLGSLYGYAYRLDNGLALEHTLYAKGDSLAKMLADKGWRQTVKESHAGDWQNFNKTATKLAGGNANNITVTFSGSYISTFNYDAATDSYLKAEHNDWRTEKPLSFKNVVVLFTSLTDFGDGYRVNVGLESGSGYYFSNGSYQEINWKKGSTYDKLTFTDKDGNPLAYNPGNSWVCLVSNGMKGKFSFN